MMMHFSMVNWYLWYRAISSLKIWSSMPSRGSKTWKNFEEDSQPPTTNIPSFKISCANYQIGFFEFCKKWSIFLVVQGPHNWGSQTTLETKATFGLNWSSYQWISADDNFYIYSQEKVSGEIKFISFLSKL